MTTKTTTYDVHFNNDKNSSSKGFSESLEFCEDYIAAYNGTDFSYFEDYKGGYVSIVETESGDVVSEYEIK